jgi:hypothetical protein
MLHPSAWCKLNTQGKIIYDYAVLYCIAHYVSTLSTEDLHKQYMNMKNGETCSNEKNVF